MRVNITTLPKMPYDVYEDLLYYRMKWNEDEDNPHSRFNIGELLQLGEIYCRWIPNAILPDMRLEEEARPVLDVMKRAMQILDKEVG